MTDRERIWPLYSDSEIDSLPEPTWLIEGHITAGMTIVYGPSAAGKTFLALDWALSIASGRPWFGREVREGPVLYVSGEGSSGIPSRRRAWRKDRNSWQAAFYLVPFGVRLLERNHIVELHRDVCTTGAKLVVVDTLARAMAGHDENSTQDMGMVVHALDWLREKTGCASLIVHHAGVESTRPRGSTALFGAADTVVRVTSSTSGLLAVECEKQKDAAPFARWHLEMRQVGESCVLSTTSKLKPRGFAM